MSNITPNRISKTETYLMETALEYVMPEFFTNLPKNKWRSLQLIHNLNVRFVTAYEPSKWRAVFRDGKGTILDLKITDPIISDRLRRKEKISKNCILTVSLATPWSPDVKKPPLCYKV